MSIALFRTSFQAFRISLHDNDENKLEHDLNLRASASGLPHCTVAASTRRIRSLEPVVSQDVAWVACLRFFGPKIFNFARSTEARHFASPDCNLLPTNTLKDSRSANAPCHLNWGTFFQRIRDVLWRLMTLDLGMMFPQHRWNCIVAKRKLHKTAAVKAATHHVVQHLLRLTTFAWKLKS